MGLTKIYKSSDGTTWVEETKVKEVTPIQYRIDFENGGSIEAINFTIKVVSDDFSGTLYWWKVERDGKIWIGKTRKVYEDVGGRVITYDVASVFLSDVTKLKGESNPRIFGDYSVSQSDVADGIYHFVVQNNQPMGYFYGDIRKADGTSGVKRVPNWAVQIQVFGDSSGAGSINKDGGIIRIDKGGYFSLTRDGTSHDVYIHKYFTLIVDSGNVYAIKEWVGVLDWLESVLVGTITDMRPAFSINDEQAGISFIGSRSYNFKKIGSAYIEAYWVISEGAVTQFGVRSTDTSVVEDLNISVSSGKPFPRLFKCGGKPICFVFTGEYDSEDVTTPGVILGYWYNLLDGSDWQYKSISTGDQLDVFTLQYVGETLHHWVFLVANSPRDGDSPSLPGRKRDLYMLKINKSDGGLDFLGKVDEKIDDKELSDMGVVSAGFFPGVGYAILVGVDDGEAYESDLRQFKVKIYDVDFDYYNDKVFVSVKEERTYPFWNESEGKYAKGMGCWPLTGGQLYWGMWGWGILDPMGGLHVIAFNGFVEMYPDAVDFFHIYYGKMDVLSSVYAGRQIAWGGFKGWASAGYEGTILYNGVGGRKRTWWMDPERLVRRTTNYHGFININDTYDPFVYVNNGEWDWYVADFDWEDDEWVVCFYDGSEKYASIKYERIGHIDFSVFDSLLSVVNDIIRGEGYIVVPDLDTGGWALYVIHGYESIPYLFGIDEGVDDVADGVLSLTRQAKDFGSIYWDDGSGNVWGGIKIQSVYLSWHGGRYRFMNFLQDKYNYAYKDIGKIAEAEVVGFIPVWGRWVEYEKSVNRVVAAEWDVDKGITRIEAIMRRT